MPELSSAEVRKIARFAGTTPAAIYARIKAGDTGARLRRKKEAMGPRPRQKVAAEPRVDDEPQSRPAPLTWSLEQKAQVIGIPPSILLARVDAGWPEDRLLDPVKRWRRRRLAAP